MRLMHSVGQVLSVMKYDDIMQYLTSLLSPLLQELQNLITREVSLFEYSMRKENN